MNEYISGNQCYFQATIKDNSDALVDPGVVTFVFKKPDDTTVTFSAPDVIRKSIGVYYVNYAPIEKGVWYFRATGNSPAIVAGETSFIVKGRF